MFNSKKNKETNYWLKIIKDTNPTFSSRLVDLEKEGVELVRIISSIIINTKRRI